MDELLPRRAPAPNADAPIPDMKLGDVVEIEISGIGVLRNPVRGEEQPHAVPISSVTRKKRPDHSAAAVGNSVPAAIRDTPIGSGFRRSISLTTGSRVSKALSCIAGGVFLPNRQPFTNQPRMPTVLNGRHKDSA